MLALQETKLSKSTYFFISCLFSSVFVADLAGAALGEGGGGKLEKLSVKQLKAVRAFQAYTSRNALIMGLAKLFGMTKPNNRERERNRRPGEVLV